jgi:hypothetical protein
MCNTPQRARREHNDDQLEDEARQRILHVVEHLPEGAWGLLSRGNHFDTLRWEPSAAELNQSSDGEDGRSDDEQVDE